MSIRFYDDGGVFVVETTATAGYLLKSHQHDHAHLSVLVSGTADVTVDGKTDRVTGYRMLTVPAHTRHTVVAVTDIVWLCLWSDDVAPREQAQESLKLVIAA